MNHPTRDRLLDLFDIDVDAGLIHWKRSRGRKAAGALAGADTHDGYRRVTVDRKEFRTHALIYFIATDEWPPLIDHINGLRSDNRIANLRMADAATNSRNRTNWIGEKLLGAFRRKDGKFTSSIRADGISYHLGVYETEKEAHERYVRVRADLDRAEREARHEVLAVEAARTPKALEMQAARAAA